jgi:hypothetical protein
MALKLMPNMTLDQQIVGLRRAVQTLRARKCGPTWLLPSLRKRLRHLVAERKRRIGARPRVSGNSRPSRTQNRTSS